VNVLALIPARGGSQGIPRKNVIPVGGRPLICWSIESALAASAVTRVIVSTDDDEIAAVATSAGAEVPFRRPAELAGPEITDLPVFVHALTWLADAEGYHPDLVVHLRPTSPARPPDLIDRAVALMSAQPEVTSLRSVSPARQTPWKMWAIGSDGLLQPLLGTLEQEAFNLPRQALPAAWLHNGVIDVIRPEVLLAGSMTGRRILSLPMGEDDGIDIDRPDDLPLAEAALARLGADAQSGTVAPPRAPDEPSPGRAPGSSISSSQ